MILKVVAGVIVYQVISLLILFITARMISLKHFNDQALEECSCGKTFEPKKNHWVYKLMPEGAPTKWAGILFVLQVLPIVIIVVAWWILRKKVHQYKCLPYLVSAV